MGLKDDVEIIKKYVKQKEEEDIKKQKPFKLPFGKKVGKAQKRKNWITIMLLNENGNVDFKKAPIEDQTVLVDSLPRLAAAGYVVYWKKNPMIILPSWSVEPFSPLEHYEKSLLSGSNNAGYRLLMARMENEKLSGRTRMSGILKWIIGFGLVAVIAYALLTGGAT